MFVINNILFGFRPFLKSFFSPFALRKIQYPIAFTARMAAVEIGPSSRGLKTRYVLVREVDKGNPCEIAHRQHESEAVRDDIHGGEDGGLVVKANPLRTTSGRAG